jgi:hypothetical protein
MTPSEIERVANEVLAGHNSSAPPVDIFAIARAEGIELAPGTYADDFSGRIEYHREAGKFILFHPEVEAARYPAQVRFSVAHELGHYFLEHHRELLTGGQAHSSASDFICDNALEREADEFGAALLIPSRALKQKLAKRPFMTLHEILRMSEQWFSSATSASIRYAKFTSEACVVVLSESNQTLYSISSDEAGVLGLRFLPKGRTIPQGAAAVKAGSNPNAGDVVEGSISSAEWYPTRQREIELWEESFPLGDTGRILTLLSLSSSK